MKRLIASIVIFVLGIVPTAWAADMTGNSQYLNFQYWLPENVCIDFYHEEGRLDGFEVSFKTGSTILFRDWRVGIHPFPFILEIKLIAEDKNEIYSLVDKTNADDDKGLYWDFGVDNECIDQPRAYYDSSLDDFQDDKFGIGIMNPHYLDENRWYSFYIKMDNVDGVVQVPFDVTLKFRLNIDVWKARNLSYDPSEDFYIGGGWQIGYNELYTPTPPNNLEVATFFSFALEEYIDNQNLDLFSDYIPNIPITGGSCRSRP